MNYKLKTKNKVEVLTIDGKKTVTIIAELIRPMSDNLNKSVSFKASYHATYMKEQEQRTVILHTDTKTYNEQQVEQLYTAIKGSLPTEQNYFDMVNRPIEVAFSVTVKNGQYFGVSASDWIEA